MCAVSMTCLFCLCGVGIENGNPCPDPCLWSNSNGRKIAGQATVSLSHLGATEGLSQGGWEQNMIFLPLKLQMPPLVSRNFHPSLIILQGVRCYSVAKGRILSDMHFLGSSETISNHSFFHFQMSMAQGNNRKTEQNEQELNSISQQHDSSK